MLTQIRDVNGYVSPWPIIVPGILLYLLIPALAGFLTARKQGNARSPANADCLVGLGSILIIAVGMAVAMVIYFNTLLPPPTHMFVLPRSFAIGVAVAGVLLESVGAVIGGLLGGWIGGLLGKRSATPAGNASTKD